MTEIPDDVMKAASEIVVSVALTIMPSQPGVEYVYSPFGIPHEKAVAQVARAIMAEREKCAQGLDQLTRSIRAAHNLNVDHTVAEIVSMIEAIRKGGAA